MGAVRSEGRHNLTGGAMRRMRRRTRRAVLAASLSAAAVMAGSAGADAAVTCTKWAATGGSDADAGTQAAPYRSLDKLVNSLTAGQTGCLPANQTYYAEAGNGI